MTTLHMNLIANALVLTSAYLLTLLAINDNKAGIYVTIAVLFIIIVASIGNGGMIITAE